MTLPEANELCAYWRDHPPVHILVAAYLGIKPKSTASPPPQSNIGTLIGVAKGGTLKAADLAKLG